MRPSRLILDEPGGGLDPVAREDFLQRLAALMERPKASGKAPGHPGPVILYVTHHVEEIIPAFTHALLLRGGIEIFERQGTMLHAKVMLIDDYWAVIGSANLDQRSFHRNYEVNVVVDSREFGNQVAEMFAEDLARSRRIVLEEHERRGFWVRLLERCCAPISWFL